MEEHPKRRTVDKLDVGDDIEKLLTEEQDPRTKLQLLILYKLSVAVTSTIAIATETADELEKHKTEYAANINKGRGAWGIFVKILLPLVAAIIVTMQGLVIYFWGDIHDSVKMLQSSVVTVSTEQARRSVVIEQMVEYMRTHNK